MRYCVNKKCKKPLNSIKDLLCPRCYGQGMRTLMRTKEYRVYVEEHRGRLGALVNDARTYMRKGWQFNADY